MTENSNSKWSPKLIGSKYRETLEEVASKCVDKVIFGEGEIEITSYLQKTIRCYYDKCNLESEEDNLRITINHDDDNSKISHYSFHKHCFSKMIIERIDQPDYKSD